MPTSSEPLAPDAPSVDGPGFAPTDVVVLRDVVKSYRLGWFGGDLRNDFRRLVERVLRRTPPGEGAVPRVQALDGVSLRIRRGENVGIIGPNGAGKSTLLKLISRITRPNSGELWVRGRVAAMIQLGAGFHDELTGRENVFLYGAILGLTQQELRHRYDDIVAFAELEDFMDTPVKRYSSGMYVRLGFAVAVNVDADILLIDEVLAVGDQAFREKCLDRMRAYAEGDTTMLFVSHNRELVERVCDRALLLDHGQLLADGPVAEVLAQYDRRRFATGRVVVDSARRQHTPPVALTEVTLGTARGAVETRFTEGDGMTVRLAFEVNEDVAAVSFGVRIERQLTLVYETCSADTGEHRPLRAGDRGVAELRLAALPLLGGDYGVSAWVETGALGHTVRSDALERGLRFEIATSPGRGNGIASLGPAWRIVPEPPS